jgi:hypothetical protein
MLLETNSVLFRQLLGVLLQFLLNLADLTEHFRLPLDQISLVDAADVVPFSLLHRQPLLF